MKKIMLFCLTTCLMMLHSLANAASPIAPFRATYTSTWNDVISLTAQATQELKTTADNQYEFSFIVNHGLLKLTETSQLSWREAHIVPQQYHYQQMAMGITRTRDTTFDWSNNTASNPKANTPWAIVIQPNTLDKLNYQLQLRADIKAGKKDLSYQVVDNAKIKTYVFKVVANEKINTPVGVVDTVKVERIRKPGDDRQTTFWLAKKWDYLLVKFKQIEKGKVYEIDLSAATIDGKPIQ